MAIRVALHYRPSNDNDRLVHLGPQVVRLRPAPQTRTAIVNYSLRVEPAVHFLNWQQDPHGNHLARLVFPEPTRRFSIDVDLTAELTVVNPFDFFLEPAAERVPFASEPWLANELRPFVVAEAPGPHLASFLRGIDPPPTAAVGFRVGLHA